MSLSNEYANCYIYMMQFFTKRNNINNKNPLVAYNTEESSHRHSSRHLEVDLKWYINMISFMTRLQTWHHK